MNITGRGGHNNQCPGASAVNVGGLDEVFEDRLVYVYMINYLKRSGQTTHDGTPGNCSENEDLQYGTDISNITKSDLFVPIHFNKAYDSYNGAIGSEIWINPKNPKAVEIGTRILNNLASVGFKNRGLKDGATSSHLHDILQSNATSILVEVCFCEATEDIRIYRKTGYAEIGRLIADGIVGKIVPKGTIPVVVSVPVTRVNSSIAQLQTILNSQGAHLLVDGFYGPKTLGACPTLIQGSRGEVTKWLQKRLAFTIYGQDGIFGNLTFSAVVKYQKAVNLIADGLVGPKTWDALLK